MIRVSINQANFTTAVASSIQLYLVDFITRISRASRMLHPNKQYFLVEVLYVLFEESPAAKVTFSVDLSQKTDYIHT